MRHNAAVNSDPDEPTEKPAGAYKGKDAAPGHGTKATLKKNKLANNVAGAAAPAKTIVAKTAPVWPPVRTTPATGTAQGFRVQIYNGSDRKKAMEVKAAFSRQFPSVKVYMVYIAPSFRVRVGNYRSRNDAAQMLQRARKINNPVMIVPDAIVTGG
jgi:hypothetical protein